MEKQTLIISLLIYGVTHDPSGNERPIVKNYGLALARNIYVMDVAGCRINFFLLVLNRLIEKVTANFVRYFNVTF